MQIKPVLVLLVSLCLLQGCSRTPKSPTREVQLHKWEYLFYFHTRNLGDKKRNGENPFTGEPVEFPIDKGLSASERESVAKILASHGFEGPEPDGEGYALYLADDQSVRIRGGELNGEYPITGFAVEMIVREITDDILDIMLELARNGNLAFTSVVGDNALFVDRLDDEKSQQRWPDAKIVQTPADLRRWLIDEIGGRQVSSFVPKRRT